MKTPQRPLPVDQLDWKLRQAILRAEKRAGYLYGAAVLGPAPYRQCFISVTFYPKARWWLWVGDAPPVPLTPELYQNVRRLEI